VATIDVSLQPARVDPNVHPAKREVGSRDADAVADAVESVVADARSRVPTSGGKPRSRRDSTGR